VTRRRGFTLTELLILVSVIGLLVALLPPSIGSAMRAARRVKCMANLRQSGVLITSYMNDYDGRFPAFPESWDPLAISDRGKGIGLWRMLGERGNFEVPSPQAGLVPSHIGVCPSDPADDLNAGRYGYSYIYQVGLFLIGSRDPAVDPSLALGRV